MSDQTVPEALNPDIRSRDLVFEATAETLEKMRKRGTIRGFTVMCDEGPHVGGDNTAPSPLSYFNIAIGFWLLTQVARYGQMMKVPIDKARVRVVGRYHSEGSVLAQTIEAHCQGVETHLEVESPETPEKVAGVIRNAENGCYTIQAIKKPAPVQTTVSLNGKPLDWESLARR